DRCGEGRTLGCFGKPRNAERTTYAHIASQDAAGDFRQPCQLTGSTCKYDALADDLPITGLIEAVARKLQRLLDAGADDAREHGTRILIGDIPRIVAERRHADEITIVG